MEKPFTNPLALEWLVKADADFITAKRECRARKLPNYDALVPRILAHELLFHSDAYLFWKKSHDRIYLLTNENSLLNEIQNMGALIFDPKPLFFDEDSKSYPAVRHGIILYRDNGHLTPFGSKKMLKTKIQYIFEKNKK